MIYNISVVGMGNKNNTATFFSMATVQGNRRYCFNKLRELLITKTTNAYEESPCFERIKFEIHIGRIDKKLNTRLDSFIIPAIDVLKYRGYVK